MQITLKAARVNAEFIQRELAKLMNRYVTTIWNWENNKTKMPIKDFKQICEILKVSESNIFFGN